MCIYVFLYKYVYIYIYIYIYMSVCIFSCKNMYAWMCVRGILAPAVFMFVVCVYACYAARSCVCICMYVYSVCRSWYEMWVCATCANTWVHEDVSKYYMKKVHLVSCNTMRVQSALQDNNEYLCRDFDDFFKYEQHCSALIIDTLIREMKYETKQYEGLVILDSPPQSEESKYGVHD